MQYNKDINNYTEDGSCPHCGHDTFSSVVIELENNEYLNLCIDCEEQSIWSNDKQYKTIE